MPQDLALFPDFTIRETLQYFGHLYRLDHKVTKDRTNFLISFLDLPESDRFVRNLSGGQKRRVSLAAALIHKPPLLILDEPTVGVDPLLRTAIWDHLVELTERERLTVIITTHYIEEARAANVVGFMRLGRILAEENPEFLLERHASPTLEEVFLKLCEADSAGASLPDSKSASPDLSKAVVRADVCNSAVNNNLNIVTEVQKSFSYEKEAASNGICQQQKTPFTHRNPCADSVARTMALFWKNITRLRRNLAVVLFQFLLPSIEVILFCACIGRDPFDIQVAVFNQEDPLMLSNMFLDTIDNSTIKLQSFNTLDTALQSVRNGESWAAMTLGKNFSDALHMR